MLSESFASALIEIRPWSRSSEDRILVRIADGATPGTYGIGAVQWDPAVAARPAISMDLSSPRLDGKLRTGRASFSISIGNLRSYDYADLFFRSAPVAIYSTSTENFSTAPTEFQGRIVTARENTEGTVLSVTCEVWVSDLDKPLLVNEFSGLGGINGDISLRGTLRPAGFGVNENIPPVWFDLVDNIGQIDGYQNTISIERLMEGASDFGPRVNDYPSYAALKAAIAGGEIKAGQWGSCTGHGLVGLGAPPVSIITVNATFGSNRIGQMCRRIITTHAGLDVGRVDVSAFDAIDAAVNRPVHYWTKEQRVVLDLFEKLARSANATPLVTLRGIISITRAVASAPVGTIDCSGSISPRVRRRQYAELTAPYWKIKARAARPAAVLSIDQVLFSDDLVEVGGFDIDNVYYAGNIVTMLNGSRWLYIDDVPKSGSVPADNNPDWQRLASDITAGNITYEDGTTLEYLKPGEPGADVTGDNTSNDTNAVGGRTAAQVLSDLDLNGMNWFDMAALESSRDAIMLARTTLDGQLIGTVVTTFRAEQVANNEAVAETFSLQGAKSGDGQSWIMNLNTNKVTPDMSFAQYMNSITASFGDTNANINDLRTIVVQPDGSVLAKAVFAIGAGNKVIGMVFTNDGSIGVADFAFDAVSWRKPDGTLMWSYDAVDDVVYMPNVRVDLLAVGAMDYEFNLLKTITPTQISQELPGGLIMKTGRYRALIGDETSMSIVFDEPFPNECRSFVPVPAINAPSNFRDLWIQIVGVPTRFGATIQTQSSTSNNNNIDGFDWTAWGT